MNDYTPTVHLLKTHPKYYRDVRDNKKPFEVRGIADRVFQVGDLLVLQEFDPETAAGYTKFVTVARVTYVLTDSAYVKDGYAILGIKILS